MSQFSRVLCLFCVTLFTSCTSTKSVKDLEQIQTTQGCYTKSLFYVGSSRAYHYFDQFTFVGDGWWIPFYEDDGFTSYRVSRHGLAIPRDWEFAHSSYQGYEDDRRVKVRIRSSPAPRVEKRVYTRRSIDDYRLKQTDPSTWTIERIR